LNDSDNFFVLNREQRARLAALGDLLIPAGSGLPSASEADVHGSGVDLVLSVREDVAELLVSALAEAGAPEDVIERYRAEDSPPFETLKFVVSSAYFVNPRVRDRLGYPGPAPEPNPALPNEADSFLADGILDVVRERGPTYRPTTKG
jgi:hypothetical protein